MTKASTARRAGSMKASAKAFAANTARLAIVGDDPMLLSQEDPAKVARANKANSIAYQPALEKIAGFDINWNIVAYPTASWAKRVFPGDEEEVAVGRLAEAIFSASRVDNSDPVQAWATHNAALSQRTAWLNAKKFHALHYSGPGTDLTIGLADGHDWQGGAATAKNGITCNPNIPTEEVFTTPHARRVDGHVASTKPLSYQGTLIDNIAVRFEAGRIVEAKASRGEDVLSKVLDTDEGARRLGEVALVPHSSPISKSGLLFFNTLFDENAACHIALGQCYAKCFVDGAKLSPDADRGAGRQQEHDPYRLDDRLGQDRHRRPRRERRADAGVPQRRVGVMTQARCGDCGSCAAGSVDGARETKFRLFLCLLRSRPVTLGSDPVVYLVHQTEPFGDMSMLGSPNLYRGNAPLALRLKIHDLHAQLAPLERYGVGAMSFAIAAGVRALVRGFGGALRGAFCSG